MNGANDVTDWLKRISVVVIRECYTIGRVVEELKYRLPEEVVRPNFAAIEDDDDKHIARQIYLKQVEKNINILAEIEKKSRLYAITMTNI